VLFFEMKSGAGLTGKLIPVVLAMCDIGDQLAV
jgi:hypothetical protein